jgi:sulfur carrier protein
MRVVVNGREHEVAAGATVRDAVVAAGAGVDERGVAVALDGTVVRRADWDGTPLHEAARLEVLRATAGG